MKKHVFPRLYQVTYRTKFQGYTFFNVFTKLGDAIDFLKYISTKTPYFFGQVYAFRTVPSVISCLDIEDDELFSIYKSDGII